MSGALDRWWRPGLILVLFLAGAVFPLVFTAQLITYFAVLTLIYLAAVVAWNLFSGYTGYISLGHAVFFGSGGYTVALIAFHHNLKGAVVFALMPLGGLVGAVLAVPFGLVALRVRRHTFVVITIAMFFIFQLMAYNLGFTNGNGGVSPPFLDWNASTFNVPFYYTAFAVTVAAIGLSWGIRHSRFGLQLLAIRDDEDRARGLGVRTMRVKLIAFVISAFIVGLLGGLWVYFIGQALPETAFDPNFDLVLALCAFLGGFGTLWGPVLGTILLYPVREYVVQQFTNGFVGEIFLGALFLLVILFLPRGLLPTLGERFTAWQARRAGRAGPAPGMAGPGPALTVPAGSAGGGESGMPAQGGSR